jgi:hypothetical protein
MAHFSPKSSFAFFAASALGKTSIPSRSRRFHFALFFFISTILRLVAECPETESSPTLPIKEF